MYEVSKDLSYKQEENIGCMFPEQSDIAFEKTGRGETEDYHHKNHLWIVAYDKSESIIGFACISLYDDDNMSGHNDQLDKIDNGIYGEILAIDADIKSIEIISELVSISEALITKHGILINNK